MKSLVSTLAAVLLIGAAHASAGETADLKLRVEYAGKAPERVPLKPDQDPQFCGKHNLMSEDVIVDAETKAIKNIVIYVYTGRGGTKLGKIEPSENVHELANKNCRFEPHIVLSQAGDTLKITNPDDVNHNCNISFFNNKPINPNIPPGQFHEEVLEKDEPAPIPVACNVHPWMKAYVLVLDHPFGGVSDDGGEITIKGLPAGKDLTFRIYHETLRLKEAVSKATGDTVAFKRGRFDLKLNAGENDLGTWVLAD